MNDNLTTQFKNYTVLYVEDEDLIRNSIINTLKYYFKEVYEAINGEDAYDLLSSFTTLWLPVFINKKVID